MRPSIILVGMTVNAILVFGIIYFNYFAPDPRRTDGSTVQDTRGKIKKSVALIIPNQGRGTDEIVQAFVETLEQEAAFAPNIKIYNANANRTLMRSNIEAAIESDSDILVPIGSQASQMAKELTEKRDKLIPIVFAGTGDPVRLELVDNVNSSGNHLTGVCAVGLEWIDQIVKLLPVLVPQVKRIFIPYDPTGLGGALELYKQRFDTQLERAGYTVTSVAVNTVNEVTEKIAPFFMDTDFVLVLPDSILFDSIEKVTKLGRQYKVGVFVAQNMAMLKKGASFTFGFEVADIGIGAARHVMRVLAGEQPTNMPINSLESAYRIGANIKNARDCGVLDTMNEAVIFLMENGEVV